MDFEKALERLINEYSQENDSNTPDFILANYLNHCLMNYNSTIKSRDKYYDFDVFDPKGEKKCRETIKLINLHDLKISPC